MLAIVDAAVEAGYGFERICGLLQISRSRVWRWQQRRISGDLEDKVSGRAVNTILPAERDAILEVYNKWADVDRSHRKLAYRGSYEGIVWVSPSTVGRVLAAEGLVLESVPYQPRAAKKPWPDWVEYRPCQVWGYDFTHFGGCPNIGVLALLDLVSRKWIHTIISVEETSTQVKLLFVEGLDLEGLLEAAEDTPKSDVPVLLAVSDNGPQMTSGDTKELMAILSIHQHFGRPHTPTDQAPIESFFGHLKMEFPYLNKISDVEQLRWELAAKEDFYNNVRLHENIGYVTPNDAHEGRAEQIIEARIGGLERARQQRLQHNRKTDPEPPK